MLVVAEQLGKIQLSLLGETDRDAEPSTVSAPVKPAWASDVSPALEAPPSKAAGDLGGPISVMHGGKTEHVCETNSGMNPCP